MWYHLQPFEGSLFFKQKTGKGLFYEHCSLKWLYYFKSIPLGKLNTKESFQAFAYILRCKLPFFKVSSTYTLPTAEILSGKNAAVGSV